MSVDDPDEIFPVVDADGRTLGTARRADCHADPALIHPSVHVAVRTGVGWLWQLRGPFKDSAPRMWDHACSGHLGVGEESAEGAVRELAEELGVRATPAALEIAGRYLMTLGNETELTTVFLLEHAGPFRLEPPELAGLMVLPPGERPQPMSPSCGELCGLLDRDRPGWDA